MLAAKEAGREAREGRKVLEGSSSELEAPGSALISSGLKVHRALGPGLLESTYEHCMARELTLRGISFRRQVVLPIEYEGEVIEVAYRLDMVVEEAIILEIKAVEALNRVHEAQLLTYLRLSGYRLGFLMNFNVSLFKNGLRRMVMQPSSSRS